MSILENQRWELFCQAIVSGHTAGDAYVAAGYRRSNSSPYQLLENPRIKERIDELRTRQVEKIVLSKQYAIEAIIENLEKALGRRPVKVGKDATEIYVYRGDVANRALQMIGHELGLFTEKKEIAHSIGEFKQYTDEELVQILEHEAQALLGHHSGGNDGNGDPDV